MGYVHGDLHLGNILLQLPSSLNTLSVELLYAQFGAPELEPVVPLKKEQACPATRVPPYAVPPVWLGIDEITAQQVHLQGPFPSEWWDRWDQRAKWFDQTGRPLSNDCDIWSWDRRFEQWIQEPRESCGMEVVTEEEKGALFEMLKRMLAWRPGERPSAEEVLGMPWMRKWGLPAYEESLRSLAKDL
ncbi:hypothetical protein HYQ45_002602 [Verticillium longisporum]|uniref:Protein kinase domain-containing protein n=1 Tax=Verticillium longisporum TaxID=100787 RepID=A0A8I3AYC8_VERLO|nr:hypothetical protein HYQ45_002602 [Verticillium longisporum]